MGILDGLRSKKAAEERAAAKQDAEQAKQRDVIRHAIADEARRKSVSAKDAQAAVDYHDTEAKYNASRESYDANSQFDAIGKDIKERAAEIESLRNDAAKLKNQREQAAVIRDAAKSEVRAAWPDGDYITAADSAADAEANLSKLVMQENARGKLIETRQHRLDALMQKQCDLDAWIDPTSALDAPLNFALCDGPRAVPEAAKATAEGRVREAREQRRLKKKAEVEMQLSELQKQVSRLDVEIEKLEAEIDKRPSGTDRVNAAMDWQKHQSLKSERHHARERIDEREKELQSLNRW